MQVSFSSNLLNDLVEALEVELRNNNTINVSQIAESVRRRHEGENIALEDIVAKVLQMAQTKSALMEFDAGGWHNLDA